MSDEQKRQEAIQTIYEAIEKLKPKAEDLAACIHTDKPTAHRLLGRYPLSNITTKWLIAKSKILKKNYL